LHFRRACSRKVASYPHVSLLGQLSVVGCWAGKLAKGACVLLQVISVLGALAILGAYAANLLGWLGPANLSYSVANLIGSGILTFIAVVDQQLGFILLEGVWALVSLWGVIQVLRGRPPEATAGH
jgi:hypothetical protein